MSIQNFMSSRLDQASRLEVEKSGSFTYVGVAKLGSLRSDAVWSIQRIEAHGSGNTITWAEGTATFDKVMNNFATYSYS